MLDYNIPLTTDTSADRVFGQSGSFTTNTCNNGGITAGSLCAPSRAALHASGDLFVSDTGNHRLSEYNVPLTTDTVADRVFGQGGKLTANNCNNGGLSASSLCYPSGVTIDTSGNLFVADSTSVGPSVFGNNRVLEYDLPLTTNTVADRVFGQGGTFSTNTCNNGGVTANSLCGPKGWR